MAQTLWFQNPERFANEVINNVNHILPMRNQTE